MVASRSPRVQGVTLKVEDLLQRLLDGSIRVPPFQRPLKWTREDNRLFFDSLLKSFPVGSLLMWVREAPAARVSLGSFHVDVSGRPGAWQVVDGQQRLTALAAGLLSSVPDAKFDFVVDLTTGDVVGPRNHPPPRWVPLSVLADTEKLIPFLRAHPDIDIATASALSKRLREYPISAAILEAEEQSFVEDVFKRLNTAGKRLTATEVFRASHANHHSADAIDRAAAIGDEFEFGPLDESNLLRALKALSGRDPLSEESIDAPKRPAEALVRGASEAVAFLKGIGVPIVELLPYSLLMGVLVAFFGSHGEVVPRNRQLLGFWFWRATFTFRMGGDFSVIRRLFKLATIEDPSEAIQALLDDVGHELRFPPFDPPPTLRSAEGKALALYLVDLAPRHLVTGEPLQVGRLLWSKKRTAFLQLPLEQGFGLLTAILHPPLKRSQLRAALATASPETLGSHLLPSPFTAAEEAGENRAARIFDTFQDFMEKKRGRADSLRPPLSTLADEDAA